MVDSSTPARALERSTIIGPSGTICIGGSSTLARQKTSTTTIGGFGQFQPRSRKAWRAWLQKHHTSSSGVWLVYAKKHTGIPSVSYNDAVEEALCFGWIDSLTHPVDDKLYKQVFTPRKPRSLWSELNRARAARMIEAGLMTAAGLAAVSVAKQRGTWEAHKSAEELTLPPDLTRALNANTAATKNWPRYSPSMRKTFLYRVNSAKRPETRARRVASIVDTVARNIPAAYLRSGKAPPR